MPANRSPGGEASGRRRRALASSAALVAATWLAPAVSGPAAGEAFKDWVIACEKREDGEDGENGQCYMAQNIALRESGQRLLHVAVGFTASGDEPPAAVFTVPLGIFLPAGVGLAIDGGETRRLTVEYCVGVGCRAVLPIDPGVEAELKKGRQAQITFQDRTRREIGVPVSLLGFTAGLNALRE